MGSGTSWEAGAPLLGASPRKRSLQETRDRLQVPQLRKRKALCICSKDGLLQGTRSQLMCVLRHGLQEAPKLRIPRASVSPLFPSHRKLSLVVLGSDRRPADQ